MVSTGKILLQLLQTKVALFTAFHCIPVDFMFGIDLPENEQICNFMDFSHKGLCWKYHDWGQNIEIFM